MKTGRTDECARGGCLLFKVRAWRLLLALASKNTSGSPQKEAAGAVNPLRVKLLLRFHARLRFHAFRRS